MVIPITLVAIIFQIWLMLAIISVHLAIAIVCTYLLAARHLNTTEISVNEHRINVTRKPLPIPFMGIHTLDAHQIDQLYCEQYIASRHQWTT